MIFVAGNYIITTKEFMLIQNHTINQKIDISQEACIFFFRLAEFFGKFLSWISLNLSTPVAPVVFLGFCSDVSFNERSKNLFRRKNNFFKVNPNCPISLG